MKIKTDSYVAFQLQDLYNQSKELYENFFFKKFKKHFMEDQDYAKEFTEEEKEIRRNVIDKLLNNFETRKFFLITEKAGKGEIMKIKDPLKVIKLLNTLPDEHATFVMNKEEFFRLVRIGNNIYFVYIHYRLDLLSYSVFRIDTHSGEYFGCYNDGLLWTLENFLRVVIYIYFSKNEFVIVKGGERHGKTRKEGKVLNETKFDMTIIDSFWNKTIMRLEGFDVDGHFRLQACGRNHQDRKLIWINPFRKTQYVRKAKKDYEEKSD